MTLESDDALLEAVARRDKEAFAALYQHFEQDSFGLALRITHDRHCAEEIVQEAMLRVWQTATTFRGEGCARAWILRIVARKSLELLRSQKSKRSLIPVGPAEQEEPSAVDILERQELVSATRRIVGQLALPDQQLLALYFGGGLSQEEIAASLSIPQQRISDRIQKTCERLRSLLAKTGFAATVPVISAEILSVAACCDDAPPTTLRQTTLSRVESSGQSSVRYSKRAMLPRHAAIWPFAAVMLGAACLTGGWFATQGKVSSAPPANKPVIAKPSASPLIYADDFDGTELAAFWEKASPRSNLHLAAGPLHTWLVLEAGDAKGRAADTERVVELVSRPIPAGPLYLQLTPEPPVAHGNTEYGIELLTAEGTVVLRHGYSTTGDEGRYAVRDFLDLGQGPVTTNYGERELTKLPPFAERIVFDEHAPSEAMPRSKSTRAEYVPQPNEDIGHYNFHSDSTMKVSGELRLRIFAKVGRGSWIRWPLDKIVLSREKIPDPHTPQPK